MTRLVAALVLLTLAACAPPPATSPEAPWRALAQAYARAEIDLAWQQLSSATREELTRAARAVAQAEHKDLPSDGRRFAFLQGSPQVRPVARIVVADQQPDRAILEVTDDAGSTRAVLVVREDGAWKVDLSEALRGAVRERETR